MEYLLDQARDTFQLRTIKKIKMTKKKNKKKIKAMIRKEKKIKMKKKGNNHSRSLRMSIKSLIS